MGGALTQRLGLLTSGRPTVTWNPLDKHADITLSSGDRQATKTTANATVSVRATYGIPHTDNGYFEIFNGGVSSASPFRLYGISTTSMPVSVWPGNDANSWGYYEQTGQKATNNVLSAYGASFTLGDVIGVAFKNGKVWFAKNNVWQGGGDPAAGTGEAFSGIAGTIYPTASLYRTSPDPHQAGGEFRSADFYYSPPSGFSPWGT
jgi:hypothetical protein